MSSILEEKVKVRAEILHFWEKSTFSIFFKQ